MQLQLPWLAYPVIRMLDKREINGATDVLELGGGGSTFYFAKRGAKVTCFETNPDWAEKIAEGCRELRLDNVELNLFAFDYAVAEAPEKYRMMEKMKTGRHDIILVDICDHNSLHRPELFHIAETIVKPGGIIILDDSHRYPQIRENNNAGNWRTYKAIGPARPDLAHTDVYFY